MLKQEYFFTCPYCGEQISILLDLSVADQEYIEDCEVCCNPISISFRLEGDVVVAFNAESIEQ